VQFVWRRVACDVQNQKTEAAKEKHSINIHTSGLVLQNIFSNFFKCTVVAVYFKTFKL
jgi:hypothetical protein